MYVVFVCCSIDMKWKHWIWKEVCVYGGMGMTCSLKEWNLTVLSHVTFHMEMSSQMFEHTRKIVSWTNTWKGCYKFGGFSRETLKKGTVIIFNGKLRKFKLKNTSKNSEKTKPYKCQLLRTFDLTGSLYK